ncbi:aminoacyl-histidine dipeptidase [Lachnospiraceae bacterium ZAX-1]
MGICKDLEPQRVFFYFEELCAIPHGSGNTKAVSDYCVAFAKSHNLTYYQDSQNNVIIIKEATIGYEEVEPIIIQGHLDMVCEKEGTADIDFTKDGLDLYIEGDFLKARKTTLGGDDGVAVAYALAILESATIAHPRLEVIFTVDEEIGMVGANAIDLSKLQGKCLLNIDSDEEGVFFTSCAGGLTAACTLPITYAKQTGICYELTVHNLNGGHSGSEIHKERANAIVVIGRILKTLSEAFSISLTTLEGGQKDNAIPREAVAAFVLNTKEHENENEESSAEKLPETEYSKTKLIEKINEIETMLKKEFQNSDHNITLTCEQKVEETYAVLDDKSFLNMLFLLRNAPNGVQNRSMDIEGLVETSLNMGIMKLTSSAFLLRFSVRSSLASRKQDIADKLTFLVEFLGGTIEISGSYPAWEYKQDSAMREQFVALYKELFLKEPEITAIHAGLECGIFSGKIKGLDCISFGPDNFDIHTPKERLSISSTQRVWKLIIEFLKSTNTWAG